MICYSASFGNNSVYSSTNGKFSTGGSTGLKHNFPFRVINSRSAQAWIPDGTVWRDPSTATWLHGYIYRQNRASKLKFMPYSGCRRANDTCFLNVYGLAKLV